MNEQTRLLFHISSILLSYPNPSILLLLNEIKGNELNSLPKNLANPLHKFIENYIQRDIISLQEEYVATFDFSTETTLYLSYYLYGDDEEKRRKELAKLKELYYKYGINDEELPDYLPQLLKLLSLANDEDAEKVISKYINAISKLSENLKKIESPYFLIINTILNYLKR